MIQRKLVLFTRLSEPEGYIQGITCFYDSVLGTVQMAINN